MPRVRLATPPAFSGIPKYESYRPYLLEHFFDHVCSFCLLRNVSMQIEHYVPVAFDSKRKNDPTNLLLACPRCNRSKGDYHPDHEKRRTRAHDRDGHLVLDVRSDDFFELIVFEKDGSLRPRGPQRDRTAWNIALLKLDLLDADREELLNLAEAVETCLELRDTNREKAELLLAKLTPSLVRSLLLLEVLGVDLSPAMLRHLRESGARLLMDRAPQAVSE